MRLDVVGLVGRCCVGVCTLSVAHCCLHNAQLGVHRDTDTHSLPHRTSRRRPPASRIPYWKRATSLALGLRLELCNTGRCWHTLYTLYTVLKMNITTGLPPPSLTPRCTARSTQTKTRSTNPLKHLIDISVTCTRFRPGYSNRVIGCKKGTSR